MNHETNKEDKEETVGIRIHKKIGWGLTDLKYDGEGRVIDPRVNSRVLDNPPDEVGPECLMHLEGLRDALPEDSDEYFDITMEIGMVTEARRRGRRIWWPVTHEPEAGRPDVLLVQPIGLPDWSRYDDPIDYAEEVALREPRESRVVPIPRGIHPFDGLYMHARTGARLNAAGVNAFRALSRSESPEEAKRAVLLDKVAGKLGFADRADAERGIVPWVPGDVRRVCAWANLFADPNTWRQLRPLLYVYWA